MAVIAPNLGLYYNKNPLEVPQRGVLQGYNFRIKNGRINNLNLGWARFSNNWVLDSRVMSIDNFFPRNSAEQLIFVTTRDIYRYVQAEDTVVYLTPVYSTGTASAVGTAVTGAGTDWDPLIQPGDFISFGSASQNAVDPGNDTNTIVLLHCNGADTTTSFPDSNGAGLAHTWTAQGDAQIDTAQSKFGGASALFDGTGDYVNTPDSTDYTLGTADFTIDFWFRIGVDGSLRQMCGHADVTLAAATSSWYFRRTLTNTLEFLVSNGSAFTTLVAPGPFTIASTAAWVHVAVVRSGNTISLYTNGVLQASTPFTGAVNDSAGTLAIGAAGDFALGRYLGWLDEFRISNVARWTSDFQPPAAAYAGWFEIDTVNSDTSITLVAGSGTVAGGPYTIRRILRGSAEDIISTEIFTHVTVSSDYWFLTNGINDVVTWDGTATFAIYHPELQFTCKQLLSFSNMMIYGDVVQAGNHLNTTIINSDVGLPLNAGATGTGLSEQFIVHDGIDDLIGLRNLGDYMVIYSYRHITLVQFQGDPLIFSFRQAVTGWGPIAPRAIADFGDYHEFVANDAQYSFDGVAMREVNLQVWRDIIRISDPLRRFQTYSHFDEENGDLIWSIPLSTDPTVGTQDGPPFDAFIEQYLEVVPPETPTPHSKRNFPFTATGYYERQSGTTWDSATGVWSDYNYQWNDNFFLLGFPQNLAGDDAGIIWIFNESQFADGVLMPSFITSGRQPTGDGRVKSLLTRFYPFASQYADTSFDISIFMANHANGDMFAAGSYTFNEALPEEKYFVSIFRRGRYFQWALQSIGTPWELIGYDYDIVEGPYV